MPDVPAAADAAAGAADSASAAAGEPGVRASIVAATPARPQRRRRRALAAAVGLQAFTHAGEPGPQEKARRHEEADAHHRDDHVEPQDVALGIGEEPDDRAGESARPQAGEREARSPDPAGEATDEDPREQHQQLFAGSKLLRRTRVAGARHRRRVQVALRRHDRQHRRPDAAEGKAGKWLGEPRQPRRA